MHENSSTLKNALFLRINFNKKDTFPVWRKEQKENLQIIYFVHLLFLNII